MGRRVQQGLCRIGLAVALTVVFPMVASAEITAVRLGFEELCSHCAAALQQTLSRVEGVDTVQVSVEPPQATLTLKAGQPLEVETLRTALAAKQFTPTWIRFEAVGLLTLHEGTTGLRVQGTTQVIPLVNDGKLDALLQTVRRDCELVFIVGFIPPGQVTARIERYEVRGLLGHPWSGEPC